MSAAVNDEAENVFEINDFTVVTEYERFIVQLESIIHDWNLTGSRPSSSGLFEKKLKFKVQPVTFKGRDFTLTYYYAVEEFEVLSNEAATDTDEKNLMYLPTSVREMLLPEFDLRSQNTVFTQYGVLEHLLVETFNNSARVDNEDFYRDILSGITVALANSGCEIPTFIRIGERTRELFNGVCLNRNAKTVYEGICTTEYLKRLGYFAGLIDMFKEKVACEGSNLPPVDALVQFDYVYQNPLSDGDDLSLNDEPNSVPFKFELDFGDNKNSVKKVLLSVLWPRLNEETVNETDNFSDLDPYASPRWLVEVKFDGSRKMLYSTMDELIDLRETSDSEYKVTHYAHTHRSDGPDMASALSMITQSNATDTTSISFVNATSPAEHIHHFARNVIKALFECKFDGEEQANELSEFQKKCLSVLATAKSAPLNSLTSKISVALAKSLNSEGGLSKMCYLWLELVDRLTARWENAEDIVGMEKDVTPDLGSCLLHQKLQMLQFCIETKRKRHSQLDKSNAIMCASSSSGSDIFYDANEEEAAMEQQPKGRLQPMEEYLLDKPDEHIYVPITQDKGPLTDDMLEALTKHLTSQTANDRVKEQLDVLLSDMQAFKAANPGARMEDFIRWHSPRDWVCSEEDGEEAHLSERMQVENNIWIDTWRNARPIPVSAQPRLFNEAKEAHAILQFFKELTVRDLIDLIKPVAFCNAGHTLVLKASKVESLIDEGMLEFCRFVVKSTRHNFAEDYFDACKKIDPIENQISWFESIEELLNTQIADGDLSELADRNLFSEFSLNITRREGPVRALDAPNGALAMCIRQIMDSAAKLETRRLDDDFNDSELHLPQPYRKHYLFRWLVPRPSTNSRPMPQRMYACVGEKYFHVTGAFSEDVTIQ